MMSFRESSHFLWYTSESEELGRGSFGTVYRGIDKVTGEPVAVKIPHSNVTVSEEIEKREIEVCKRINHENIVRLLGYEEERNGGGHRRDRPLKVLVMELCNGGSLYKILDHPKNHFGLEEDEFLTVLKDLTAGMKYLRENDIIHRDLKPANIMRSIGNDGASVYKIADFGAARELPDNQEYSSIFGTEEYLDPDVYEQRLLPGAGIPTKKFSPSTDLWSIGATLYHVATGVLPFRPINGRKNRKVMHIMTTKKDSGVISAYQKKDTEEIVYQDKLPKSCMLSHDLKIFLCSLLAGLMEVDPRKKLSFESYFRKVGDFLKMKKLHLFYFNKLQLLRVYVDPMKTQNYANLTTRIQENTSVLPEDQILLFKDCTLATMLDNVEGQICSKLPQTSDTTPVILCSRSDTEVSCKHHKIALKKLPFPNTVDFNRDADIATHNCLLANFINKQIHSCCHKVKLIDYSVLSISQVVAAQLTACSKENTLVCKAVQSMKNQFDMMECFHSLSVEFAKLIPEDVNDSTSGQQDAMEEGITFHESVKQLNAIYSVQFKEFQKLQNMLTQLKPSIDALLGSRVQNRFLMNSWEKSSAKVKGVSDFLRTERISTTLVSSIDQSYAEFTGDIPSTGSAQRQRRRAPLAEEECIHLIERTKMIQTMMKMERLQTECLLNLSSLNSVVSDWYKQAITSYIQPEILSKDIRKLQEKLAFAEQGLVEAVRKFKLQLGQITQTLKVFTVPVVVGNIQDNHQNDRAGKSAKAKIFRDRIREVVRVQEEIQAGFKTNFELCDQLQGLLMNSFSDANPSA